MTFLEARDAMYNVFYSVWDVTHPVAWGDLPATPPSTDTPWARVKLLHTGGGNGSLAGDSGCRRFKRTGILTISIFAPVGSGLTQPYALAQKVSNAYEDARLDVWFRNTRIREMGASGAFEQVDVLTEFFYDEVR